MTDILENMMQKIIHRGPDSGGKHIDDGVSMGFRRLSIIDLEGGTQPIYNETKDMVITFNGEIYNHLELREELLQKATPLTPEEREHIKNHPIIAAREILKPISYIQDVLPIIEHHHENWDGTGYPNKIEKEEIPLTSQIILIIDEYFALIEPRPYRSKMSTKDAIEIIKSDAGKKWNKNLVDEFISLMEHDIV